MEIKYRKFSGGYRFRNYEGQPKNELVVSEIPDEVVIPLKQGFGNELSPQVAEGDILKAGQIIARDDNSVSSPIHSSINGIVKEIKKINYFKQEISSIIIKSDGTDTWEPLSGYSQDWERLPTEKLEELVYLSGVSSLDREGIPTAYKSSIIPPRDVKNIIVHGVGSEVYNLSLSVLLKGKKLFYFVEGLKILNRIMPEAKVHLALNRENKSLLEEVPKLLGGQDWIEIYGLEPKYPQGYDEVLIPTLLGEKFPYGYSAANIGVVVLNMQAVIQVYEAVTEGKPLIERTIALCGPGFNDNFHIQARIGTPVSFIVNGIKKEDRKLRFILNSLLTGVSLSDLELPVSRSFTEIISIPDEKNRDFLSFMRTGIRKDSFSSTFLAKFLNTEKECNTNLKGNQRPCVFCNFCQDVCPVSIIPHLFFHHVKNDFIDETIMNLGIFNCIQCKLCSFVCPSKIPLADYIKEGEEKLNNKCYDRALCILPRFDLKGLEEYRGIK